ncbi:MAG: hypothetical protein F6K31_08230 [Symploca sp. SIO2G7]|nr:hypothetical protein [Symploca sp. SIO2G7]
MLGKVKWCQVLENFRRRCNDFEPIDVKTGNRQQGKNTALKKKRYQIRLQ